MEEVNWVKILITIFSYVLLGPHGVNSLIVQNLAVAEALTLLRPRGG